MDNANLPAMPICNDNGVPGVARHVLANSEPLTVGLTKREYFATMAMQGLCAHSGDYHRPEDLAHDAVMYADALLAELEKPNAKS